MGRPVLLICPAFYPYPAVGAVRATHWARMLPSRGWTPHVATREPGRRLDPEAFAREVHPEVVLHALGAFQQSGAPPGASGAGSRAGRLRSAVAEPLLVPDAAIVFWRRAVPRLVKIARDIGAEAIISTAPPESIHAAGMAVHKATGIPWIADFRDPHILDERFMPSGIFTPIRALHARFDRRIYEQASAITHAINMHDRWARLRYPASRDRCIFLPHFCPPDLLDGSIAPALPPPGRRSIRAVGHLGDDQALALARAIRTLMERRGDDLEFRHAGRPPGCAGELVELLGERMVIEGRVPHNRAQALVAGADVLIAALDPHRSTSILISSKLYEYIAARRPLLVINPSRPDRQLLRQIPSARVLATPAPEAITEALAAALDDRSRGTSPDTASIIERYSHRRHADTLAAVLDRVTGSPSGPPRRRP